MRKDLEIRMARNRKPENRGRLPQYNPSEDDTESFNVSKQFCRLF